MGRFLMSGEFLTNEIIRFNREATAFKGFISTWMTWGHYDKGSAKQIINQLKNNPLLTNIQYVKRKYSAYNGISVSFKTEADEAAFLLLTSGGNEGISVEYYIKYGY